MSKEIFRHESGATESWLVVNADGTLTYHEENAGWRMMRSGMEVHDKQFTPEEAKAKWPSYADKIGAVLAETNCY